MHGDLAGPVVEADGDRHDARHVVDELGPLEDAGVAAVIVTDIARDGTLEGPDVEGLARVLDATGLEVIASGGVGSLADIEAPTSLEVGGRRLAGVIVGRALHDGAFTVEEAIAACAACG